MSFESSDSILVVDDDQVFRRRLARAFRDRGLSAFEASNGSEALRQVLSERPSLIVLDLRLGKESGLVLLRELIKLHETAKIVVLTGYGTITTAVEALKSGAFNYLTKPVDADTVLEAFSPKADLKGLAEIETPHLDQVEWDHIQRVLNDFGGNITLASKALGLHRRSLQRKLSKHPKQLV